MIKFVELNKENIIYQMRIDLASWSSSGLDNIKYTKFLKQYNLERAKLEFIFNDILGTIDQRGSIQIRKIMMITIIPNKTNKLFKEPFILYFNDKNM